LHNNQHFKINEKEESKVPSIQSSEIKLWNIHCIEKKNAAINWCYINVYKEEKFVHKLTINHITFKQMGKETR